MNESETVTVPGARCGDDDCNCTIVAMRTISLSCSGGIGVGDTTTTKNRASNGLWLEQYFTILLPNSVTLLLLFGARHPIIIKILTYELLDTYGHTHTYFNINNCTACAYCWRLEKIKETNFEKWKISSSMDCSWRRWQLVKVVCPGSGKNHK